LTGCPIRYDDSGNNHAAIKLGQWRVRWNHAGAFLNHQDPPFRSRLLQLLIKKLEDVTVRRDPGPVGRELGNSTVTWLR
jgi:hypothetical protein